MFHLHQSLDYYLYPYPVDMRKSFYTLSGVVSSEMDRDVQGGEVFIFINRQQNIMKILHMEYAGMVIYHKKLDSGRFKLPEYDPGTGIMPMSEPGCIRLGDSRDTGIMPMSEPGCVR